MAELLYGFQGVDFTSAGDLFGVRELFKRTHEMNGKAKDEDWHRIELYPTIDHVMARKMAVLLRSVGVKAPVPTGITVERIEQYQKEFPCTKVERVHADFFYNKREKLLRLSQTKPYSLKGLFVRMVMDYFFGSTYQMRGINLAKELGVGVNIHANGIFGLEKEGRLKEARNGLKFMLAENGLEQSVFSKGSDKIMDDPIEIIRRMVVPYALDGFLLGVDHLNQQRKDILAPLGKPDIMNEVKAMHIAGDDHGIIFEGDSDFRRFVSLLATTAHPHPIRLAFDYNPFHFQRYSFADQLRISQDTITWMKSVQDITQYAA